jgi:hypothetical protein
MEDDTNAGFSWALFLEYCCRSTEEAFLKERKQGAKMRRWLGAGCAAALFCACISASSAVAQASAGSKAESPKGASTKAKPATTSTKKHTKAAASKPATKTHSTSHAASGTHSKSSATAVARNSNGRRTGSGKSSRKKTARGQQKIDPERAQKIQEALIRERYLSGEASGTWNQSSEEAMRRYQADHGWQSKTVPDSRALISLGLGPSHDHLLNPESAMVTGPFPTHSASLTPVSHSADPGAQGNTPASTTPAPTSDHNASGPQ